MLNHKLANELNHRTKWLHMCKIFSLMSISTGKQEKFKVDYIYINLTTHECTRNELLVEGNPTCWGRGLTDSWWWGVFKLKHGGTCSLMMGGAHK